MAIEPEVKMFYKIRNNLINKYSVEFIQNGNITEISDISGKTKKDGNEYLSLVSEYFTEINKLIYEKTEIDFICVHHVVVGFCSSFRLWIIR